MWLSRTVSVSCLYRKRSLDRTHQFCRQFDNNFDKLWGGRYHTYRPRLTKYCRVCVPGIPGGVGAYACFTLSPLQLVVNCPVFTIYITVLSNVLNWMGSCCPWYSGGLQQPGSSEWRVAETNRQRGNDRLLHVTSEMESTMWRQPLERNRRRLQCQPW